MPKEAFVLHLFYFMLDVQRVGSYVFHAMDPSSVASLHLAYRLLVVENSHSVTDEKLLLDHTQSQTYVAYH